jgi:hypothetical protein
MSTIRCRSCLNLVAFRGTSTVCPGCRARIVLPPPGEPLGEGENDNAAVGPRQATLLVKFESESISLGVVRLSRKQVIAVLLSGFGLLVLVGVLVGVAMWIMAQSNRPTPAPAPPPAPAPVRQTAPPPPPPPPPAPTTTAATLPRQWVPIRAKAPRTSPTDVTAERVDAGLRAGVINLLSRFDGPVLRKGTVEGNLEGASHALTVYALLAAGKELGDPSLGPRSPMMQQRLDRVRSASPPAQFEVYARSVRLQCLALANRPEDRGTIEADLKWMLASNINGAFGYGAPRPGDTLDTIPGPVGGWDASNSQYGLLGVWAAAMAGFDTPASFWAAVENHWLGTRDPATGAWSYRGGTVSLAMTTAGINALIVAQDQLTGDRSPKGRDPNRARRAVADAIEFVSRDNRIASFHTERYGYSAYGMERVALASGIKYFGGVDWYRSLASRLLADQRPDGSWNGPEIQPVDTAFAVLCLARGRPPIMFTRLRYDGNWNRNPRDLAALSAFASDRTERPLAWQIVPLAASWRDWLDAPIAMLSGDGPINLGKSDLENLRQYMRNGGILFTHADGGSAPFTEFVQSLAPRLIPGLRLEPLPPDHPLYSIMVRPDPAPPLLAAAISDRIVWLHSPTDLTSQWLRRAPRGRQQALETGLNAYVFAAGKSLQRRRLDSAVVPEPTEPPVGTLPVARVSFGDSEAGWDPEPAAWPRIGTDFELATRIRVELTDVSATDLTDGIDTPLATLTSASGIPIPADDAAALRRYIASGGVVLVDACRGSELSARWALETARAILGPDSLPPPLAIDHPLLTGVGYQPFSHNVTKVRASDYTIATRGGRLALPRAVRLGKGWLVVCETDLTTSLLGINSWGTVGYAPEWGRGLVHNLLLSVAAGTPLQPGPGSTTRPGP